MPRRTTPLRETEYQRRQDPAAKQAIRDAWAAAGGHPGPAARSLDLAPTTLYREIRRLWPGTPGGEIPQELRALAGGTQETTGAATVA